MDTATDSMTIESTSMTRDQQNTAKEDLKNPTGKIEMPAADEVPTL